MRAIVSSLAASFLSSSPSSPTPLNRHRGRTIGAATALKGLLLSAVTTRKKRLLLRLPCCIALSSSSSSSFASGLTLTTANAFVPSPPTALARRSISPLSSLASNGMAPPQRKKQKRTSPSGKSSGNDGGEGGGNGNDDPAPTAFVIILSPAKTLDLECGGLATDEPIRWTRPGHVDPSRTRAIADRMRDRASSSSSSSGLGKLLGVSAKIADAARSYWNDFDDGSAYRRLPCGFMLKGPAYQGLDLPSMASAGEEGGGVESVAYLQRHLRIVDPVWGLLRPMDAIPPYRLEMATKNVFANDAGGGSKGKGKETTRDVPKKLADYWKPAIQSALAKATEAAAEGTKGGSEGGNGGDGNGTVVINLASDEYAAAVLPLPPGGGTSVKVVFRNQGRTIAVHAKRARGLFARFLAERRVATLEEFWDAAPAFAAEGYAHQEGESSSRAGDGDGGELTVVYDRAAVPAKPKKKAK